MGNKGQSRRRQAGVAGGVAAVWYALPDRVPQRRHRALLKGLLVTVVGGFYARSAGTPGSVTTDARSQDGREERDPTGELAAKAPAWWLRLGTGTQAGIAAAVVTSLVGGSVVQERLIFRIGERLARRGVSHPHTRIGLTLGALVALAALPTRPDAAT